MIDELKEEEIVNKVGGRFKLSTLIQKRMIALNQGARALVDGRGVDKMTMVIQEIMQDKIYLDMSGKLQTNEPTEELESDGGTVDLTQSDGLTVESCPVHRMSRPGRRSRRTRPRGIARPREPAADHVSGERRSRRPRGWRPGASRAPPSPALRSLRGIPCSFDSDCCARRQP